MATIIKEIEVDVSQLNRFAAIVAKQYDKQSRFLKVTLLDSGERIKVNLHLPQSSMQDVRMK